VRRCPVDPFFGCIILGIFLNVGGLTEKKRNYRKGKGNHFGISSFSHPDNALEVCVLLTPLHIVPEWYFLSQYAMLKAVPNKNAGFIILLSSIFTFFFIGEIRNLTTFTRLMDYNNGFSLSSLFLSLLSFLWISSPRALIL